MTTTTNNLKTEINMENEMTKTNETPTLNAATTTARANRMAKVFHEEHFAVRRSIDASDVAGRTLYLDNNPYASGPKREVLLEKALVELAEHGIEATERGGFGEDVHGTPYTLALLFNSADGGRIEAVIRKHTLDAILDRAA